MKKLTYMALIAASFIFASCKKDNYDAPTAGLSGSFLDAETGGLVEQDIIRGTTIEIIEHGYTAPQYLIVKNNGTYDNSLLFANTYTITPVRGNFAAVAAQEVSINGQTKLDFRVTPYIRVKDVNIVKNGTKITATFKLQQTVTNNVKKIGLYAHPDARVGEPMRLVAAEQELNAVTDPNHVYTLEIDLAANTGTLKPGSQYYFRVGALIDAGEAKLNYVPAVKLGV
ncbi:DUF3823 domain-containing protein [Chitinophaga agrisoli]|uniref:DUF3823 domain-containing protein n=1 Tax=Chitinophaga agrisoli TaxID=2607653 RepID=A0A5B2VRN5_9BACT|nr:DUF3823 domain-containing protein [Chitinophaga agrisoli]KAA2241348.1 DUF3823 domain-containing protein [Chitinophaga agrisoli]